MQEFLDRLQARTQAATDQAKSKAKHLLWLIPVTGAVLIVLVVAIAGATALVVGNALYDLEGVPENSLAFKGQASDQMRKQINKEVGDEIRASLDCSNFPPSEARPGQNCLIGLIEFGENKEWSPVPTSQRWLVPLWKRAAEEHNIPWELLAAVNGTRSQFGKDNCKNENYQGFYRVRNKFWQEHAIDAGQSRLARLDVNCTEASPPIKVNPPGKRDTKTVEVAGRKDYPGSSQDPVDSTFAVARALGSQIENQSQWNYNGSPPENCFQPGVDGQTYYPPEPPLQGGGMLGYNKNLEIPRHLVQAAAKWRSDQGILKPRRNVPGSEPHKAMPKALLMQMLVAAWQALGKPPAQAKANAELNYQQIILESGGRPYILQGFIGDVNDNNPAGGLVQFIPSTFETWMISGFEDRFNPLDNILAAVNAQVNSEMGYILSGASGWSPSGGANPYTSGGKSVKVVSSQTIAPDQNGSPAAAQAKSYQGKPQTDPVSKAVRTHSGGVMSPCYVAVVNQWYQAIKENPPTEGGSSDLNLNFDGTRWIGGKGKWVPCPSSIPHDTGNPCYVDNRIVPNLIAIHKKFDIYISDGYDGPLPNGVWSGCGGCHSLAGEHPLGVGVDIVPNPAGGSWEKIDQLAKWAEPVQNQPRKPFRWVGYDGDANHGSGHHLHLSWDHSGAPPHTIVDKVLVFGKGSQLQTQGK
jgi:hypothetical protein